MKNGHFAFLIFIVFAFVVLGCAGQGGLTTTTTSLTTGGTVTGTTGTTGTEVVFISNRHGNQEIYVIGSDGFNLERITNTHSIREEMPFFSPDGASIVFCVENELWRMNADGTNRVQLTFSDLGPTFPSYNIAGTHIYFTGWSSPFYDVFRMKANGTELTKVTTNGQSQIRSTWVYGP